MARLLRGLSLGHAQEPCQLAAIGICRISGGWPTPGQTRRHKRPGKMCRMPVSKTGVPRQSHWHAACAGCTQEIMRCKPCQSPACCPPPPRRMLRRSPLPVDRGSRGNWIKPCPPPVHRRRSLLQRRMQPRPHNAPRSRRPGRTGLWYCGPDRRDRSLWWRSRPGAGGRPGRRHCRSRRKSPLPRPTTGMVPCKAGHRCRVLSRRPAQVPDRPKVCRKLNRRRRPGPRNRRRRPWPCHYQLPTPPAPCRFRCKHQIQPAPWSGRRRVPRPPARFRCRHRSRPGLCHKRRLMLFGLAGARHQHRLRSRNPPPWPLRGRFRQDPRHRRPHSPR